MAALDQLRHLAEEEGEQQRADMGAVDIGVRHDDDLVIAQLVDVEIVLADAGAERGDQRADLVRRQHLVEAGALDIEDLAAQGSTAWFSRLRPCLAEPPAESPSTRNSSDLAGSRSWQSASLPGREATSSAPLRRVSSRALRAASRAAAASTTLVTIVPGFCRMLLEPAIEALVGDQVLDDRADFRGDQLVLGLAGEFRIGHLDGQARRSAPPGVVAGQRDLFLLGISPVAVGIAGDLAGQRARKPARWVPPSRCGMLLVKHSTFSW